MLTVTVEVSRGNGAACPGDDAVTSILAVPLAKPVTTPLVALTEAIVGLRDTQVTVRPKAESDWLAADVNDALSPVVAPTETFALVETTLATGANETVTGAVPDGVEPETPPPGDDAVIVATCAAELIKGVTTPAGDTMTCSGLLDDHTIVRPVNTLFAASRAVAVSVMEPPSTTDVAPVTVIVAIGTCVTVTVAKPVTPPIRAVIVALPAATAVIVLLPPVADVFTVATATLLDAQVTGRPVSTLLLASRAVAVMGCVDP